MMAGTPRSLCPDGAKRRSGCALPALRTANGSPLVAHQAALFARPVAFLLGLALVVQLLALGKRELDLGSALVVEIELERHQRHALALDRADQLVDLALVQQQLARALLRMIEAAGLHV